MRDDSSVAAVDTDAPLSKWGIFSSHDSAAECEQGLVAFYKVAKTELVANPADERERGGPTHAYEGLGGDPRPV